MVSDFVVGQIYNRRQDIHDRFGGQRQSGIVTPSEYPAVFIFTGRGAPHGYADEWSADGTFRYFGEGQKGDMTLTKGNKAVANHAVDGKDLLLFDMLGGGRVRFRGPFNCAGYSFEDGKDSSGNIRKAIVFHLVPVAEEGSELETPSPASKRELGGATQSAQWPRQAPLVRASTKDQIEPIVFAVRSCGSMCWPEQMVSVRVAMRRHRSALMWERPTWSPTTFVA